MVAIETGGLDGTIICGAYVAAEGTKPAAAVKRLSAIIPKYMIPQKWLRLDELPKNVNGKIDRPALRDSFAALVKG